MGEKIRILHVGISEHLGGVETYLLKITKNIDRSTFEFAFLAEEGKTPCFLRELTELGAQFYYVTPRSENVFRHKKQVEEIINDNTFDIIHCHQNSLSNIRPVIAGIKAGKGVIVHSHNSACLRKLRSRVLHKLNYYLLPKKQIQEAAVSDVAAEWMFGKSHNAVILNNGLCTDDYAYNEKARNELRAELGLDGKEVILHTGAFRRQKNHEFILEIFKSYVSVHPDAVLLLAGDGELKLKIQNIIHEYGLENSVILLGNRDDVPRLLSAADKFLFPSLYEGFPCALIEAECSGLYCVVSDVITEQATIEGLCSRISLSAPVSEWVTALERKSPANREAGAESIKSMGLDIASEMKRLEALYNSVIGGSTSYYENN